MFKCVYLDSNCTIEDDCSFRNAPKTYLKDIADVLGCHENGIIDLLNFFYASYGKSIWEYHEIFWRTLVNRLGYKNNRAVLDQVYNIFLDFYEKNISLYPEVIQTLTEMKPYCRLVLVANGNSKRLERLIKKYQLTEYFDDFVISSETPYKKPDQFMFNYGLCLYGFSPDEVLMVGDRMDNDVIGAKKSGIHTVLVNRFQSNNIALDSMADFSISSLSELKTILDCTKNLIQNRAIKSKYLIAYPFDFHSSALTAFVVAGGKGSRLGDIGKSTQKCMLPIWDGKPILSYVITILKSIGCKRVVIAVNHLSEQIIDYYKDGTAFGIEIEYTQGNFASTYDALYSSLDKLSNDFIYMHGDILFEPELLFDLVNTSNNNMKSCVGIIKNKGIHLTHAQMDIDANGVITNIDLTERDEHYPYTFLGIAVYKKRDFIELFDGKKDGMVEKNILQKINANRDTLSVVYHGNWRHFETEQDYIRAKNESAWNIF